MVREKKGDINPLVFKFGVAFAISLGGIFYSFFRTNKNMKPSQSSSPSGSPSGFSEQIDSEGIKALVKDDSHSLQNCAISSDCDSASTTPEKQENLIWQTRDKNQTLLPEFDELVKEFDMPKPRANISPEDYVEIPCSYVPEFARIEREKYEEEIKNLNDTVVFLTKRVSTLEVELLKYYGLKEQNNTITELQNRVKIHNTEAKLFNLKIEAFQVDNKKLKAQVVDYAKVASELEAAKTTIKLLKNRLKAETDHNKEQILSLQQRVKKMQEEEIKAVSGDLGIELKLRRMKELEDETAEFRRSNHSLRVENSELAQKLEKAQMLATSLQGHKVEVEALKEETHNLRQQNEDLFKQVEQLQSSWYVDIEELVYLRWVNACLRYELRNFQPEPGKTSSRDLSKTLSPKSEEKAKQLIKEYASKQGLEEKGRHIAADSDFDQWSFSELSHSSGNGEFDDDDSSFDRSSANKTDTSSKRRIFSKLRRLLRGEDDKSSIHDDGNLSLEIGFGEKNRDEIKSRRLSLGSGRSLKGFKTNELKELERRRRFSDLGLPRVCKSYVVESENLQENQPEEKAKLVKYAEVLKKGSSGENSNFHRRAVSHS